MNGKQSIIDKIIADAEKSAADNIALANAKSDSIISDANAWAQDMRTEKLSSINEQVNELIKRRRSVALLDKKRNISAYKSELTKKAFDEAITVFKADKKTYKSYLENLLKDNAEDGDEIVVSAEDVGILSAAAVSRVAKSLKIKLSISENAGEFRGGLILVGKNYDKNLTLDDSVRRVREQNETEVAAILFKEN